MNYLSWNRCGSAIIRYQQNLTRADDHLRVGSMRPLQSIDEMQDIHRRQRVSNLQARRELLEIQRDALMHEITPPPTSQDRRKEMFARRDELLSQWARLWKNWKSTRESNALLPRCSPHEGSFHIQGGPAFLLIRSARAVP